jgi:hypothetical protein
MAKSFREDRDGSSAAPDVHPQLEDKPSRWYGGKRRHFPQQPKGLPANIERFDC